MVHVGYFFNPSLSIQNSKNTLKNNCESLNTGKDPDAGKDWGQGEKGETENEMVGWHHQLDRHELTKLWEIVKDREALHASVHGVTKSWTRLSEWTTKTERVNNKGDTEHIFKYIKCNNGILIRLQNRIIIVQK